MNCNWYMWVLSSKIIGIKVSNRLSHSEMATQHTVPVSSLGAKNLEKLLNVLPKAILKSSKIAYFNNWKQNNMTANM